MRGSRRQNLSHGMAIDAAIEARLLGMRLLKLDAKITVLPPEQSPRRWPEVRSVSMRRLPAVRQRELPSPTAHPALSNGATNGRPTGALAQAAHSLAASAADLEAARAGMPPPPRRA